MTDLKIFFRNQFLVGCLVLTFSGCVPLVVGAAVGAGGYAWIKGELVNEMNVPAEKLHKAATRAVRDLKLRIKEDKGDRLSAKILAQFSDNTDVVITVEARTEKTSSIKIRVGILGDKEKSELILSAIQKRL